MISFLRNVRDLAVVVGLALATVLFFVVVAFLSPVAVMTVAAVRCVDRARSDRVRVWMVDRVYRVVDFFDALEEN